MAMDREQLYIYEWTPGSDADRRDSERLRSLSAPPERSGRPASRPDDFDEVAWEAWVAACRLHRSASEGPGGEAGKAGADGPIAGLTPEQRERYDAAISDIERRTGRRTGHGGSS
jgi:hypothetical protein